MNNPDQCHVREMETLGDHLCAHEDIDFAGAKVAEDPAVIFFAFQGVRVHPPDARAREQFRERVLHLFRAQTRVKDSGVAALFLRTNIRRGRFVAADVAANLLFGAMIGQGHAAIGALGNEAALGTLERRRVAAAVQEQHHLLASLQPQGDFLLELLRKNGRALLLARFLPHVNDAHERHFPVVGALRQLEQRVFPLLRVVETLERGCG